MRGTNIAIVFTPEQLDYTYKVLAQRPFHEVAGLLRSIEEQIANSTTKKEAPQDKPAGPKVES